jgi:hypothetical protein
MPPRDIRRARAVYSERVDSSNVHSALWNNETTDMYIRFLRSGPDDIYRYPDREAPEWVGFQNSASKGAWVWRHPIGENWPYELETMREYRDIEPGDVDPGARTFLFG